MTTLRENLRKKALAGDTSAATVLFASITDDASQEAIIKAFSSILNDDSATVISIVGEETGWNDIMEPDVASLPVSSVCGALCLALILRASLLMDDMADISAVEEWVIMEGTMKAVNKGVMKVVNHQANVIYYG